MSGNDAPLGVAVANRVTPDVEPSRIYTPTGVLIDPHDPRRVYAGGADLHTRTCSFFRSTDGGLTWEQTGGSPSPSSHPHCSHTSQFYPMGALAMGENGTIYYLQQGWAHQDAGSQPNSGVFLARSSDRGESWEVTAVRDTRGQTAPDNQQNFPHSVALDIRDGKNVVYVSWTATFPSATPQRPPLPTLAVSVDGGESFGAPIDLSAGFFGDADNIRGEIPPALKRAEHFGGVRPDLTLDAEGTLYAVWTRRSANVGERLPQPQYLSASSDGGRNFRVSEVGATSTLEGPAPSVEWGSAPGPNGALHLVYEDKSRPAQGDRDVHYRRSTDQGHSWSQPRILNDERASELFLQALPTVATSPNGRVDVVWWDLRAGATEYSTDVFYAYSPDGGATWSPNIRVGDISVNRRFGSWVENHGDNRQPVAMASGDAVVALVWDDTRNGTVADPAQDLYGSAVQFKVLQAADGGPPEAFLLAALGSASFLIPCLLWHRFRRDRQASVVRVE